MTTYEPLIELFVFVIKSDFCSSVKMPRSKKVQVEEQADAGHEPTQLVEQQPAALTKADYLKARATIKQFREEKKNKPKRKCSDKQLAALAAGRSRNQRFAKNQVKPSD